MEDIEFQTSNIVNDYFAREGDLEFAGKHILLDIWGARQLEDGALLERVLRDSVTAAGATLLHLHIHQFSPTGGLSGTAILAESHINVHTWPERGFAAFDVFMCGQSQPEKVADVIKTAYQPTDMSMEINYRGQVAPSSVNTGTDYV